MTGKAKRQLAIIVVIGLLFLFYLGLTYLPVNLLPIQQKPVPQPVYDYYEIVDENGGESLMVVPLVVNVGDELLTEDNRKFKVVKVVENTAYARRMKNSLRLPGQKE